MRDADLLIVGGGTAGLAAAVTAAEQGLDTILVEKTDRLGGQLHWSFGQFSAAGTRRQHARGISDHPDEHFTDVMRIAGNRATPHLVRRAVDAAGPMVDWLEGLGFPFADECPALVFGHEVYGRPRTYWGGRARTQGGLAILRTLRPRVVPPVEVRLGSRLVDLVLDGGHVRGIVVDTPDGRRELTAPHTLVTTGGYAANRQLLQRLQPRWPGALTGCLDHATGDAHLLLEERLGVALTHGELYVPAMGMIEDPERPGFGFRLSRQRLVVDAHSRLPWELWVNRDGRRFVAEDTASRDEREHALLQQPDLAMAAIWDQHAVDHGPPVIGPGWTREEEGAEADRGRWLFRSRSLRVLARRLGVDADGLIESVEVYNTAVGAARRDAFGRQHRPAPVATPPFYGVVSRGGMLLSRGGPVVDDELRPIGADGEPVGGIRLAGEVLGMSQFSGDAFAGGMSIGPALALGRWVVHQIADVGAAGDGRDFSWSTR